MFNIKDADLIFNEVYDALVINHKKNNRFEVDISNLSEKSIKELKDTLKSENIQYTQNKNKVVCFLSEKSKENARHVYTDETIRKLKEEEREQSKEFMKNLIHIVK